MARHGRNGWRLLAGISVLTVPAVASAQDAPLPATDAETPDARDDIVVTGKRPPGSAIGENQPVAVLDAEMLRAMGATSIAELLRRLKPLTTSTSGGEPVFLLNGRRIAGFGDIQSLPPEAMERTEILSEQDAPRFGFPATVRIVNFVTKKHFRAITVEQGAGTTTEGGGETAKLELGSTRIDGNRRTTLAVNYDRQNPLFAGERPYLADTDGLFDTTGNVRALTGEPIDSRPDRVTDLSPFLSLRSRDALKVDGTHAIPLGKTMTASINLTMEAERGSALAGLQGAALRVAAANPANPFGRDVLLYRYLDEAGVLRQRNDNLTLHAASTVQGGFGRWMWTVTGGYDRVRARTAVDRGIAPGSLQAAVDTGADPFDLPPAIATADRLTVRSRTVTDTLVGKATANGTAFQLPAGPAQLTLNADYALSNSNGLLVGDDGRPTSLRRVVRGGSASLDLPIASPDRGVLSALGSLSANATLGVTGVSDYGSLTSSNVALTWSPWRPVQITASVNTAQTPPQIASLTNPVVTVPNTPFFDFLTGTSTLIAVTGGGNTDLAPEERRVRTVGIGWQPIQGKELRFNLNYIDTRITDQAANLVSATAALQAAFPDRFVRDAAGQLLRADLRPVNLFRETERKVQAQISLWTPIGAAPPPPKPPEKGAPPPPRPRDRPMVWSFVTATARIDDRLALSPGQPLLDLLDGATPDGNSGRARYELQGNVGGSIGAFRLGTYMSWRSATRIRSDIAASDLRFSALTFAGLYSQIDGGKLAPQAKWARNTTLQFEVQNLLNARTDVRDRTGRVPYRFQPSLIDPYGRIAKLSVRKLF